MVKFDDVLNDINGFGFYQKLRLAFVCVASILVPIVTYIHSFTAANPKHRCSHPNLLNDTYFANTSDFTGSTNITLHQCSYIENNIEYKNCSKWVFDKTYYESTLTEEWNMVCDSLFWRSNLQTIFFLGVLIGSILLGIIADRFGRRITMLYSFMLVVIAAFGAAFGPQRILGNKISYAIYATSRLLLGIGTRGINTIGFVLAMELVSSDMTTFAGFVFQYFFAIGQLVLMIPVFLLRNWRDQLIFTAVFSIPFLLYYLIANNLMFYGVGLKSNDLGVNPYLSFTISAVVELLGLVMGHMVLDRFGRKYPYGICLTSSGVSCLLTIFISDKYASVTLAMIGKFFVSASYGILYIYSSEIFPTSIRSSCMGTCSMMARIGSMIAPQINALGDKSWAPFPFLVFGLSGTIVGISTIILPETLGRHLPRNIKEAEQNRAFMCCERNSDKK